MSSSDITKIGRKQSLLLPDMIDNYIDANNPAGLFASFVDSFDLKVMNFRYAVLEQCPGKALVRSIKSVEIASLGILQWIKILKEA